MKKIILSILVSILIYSCGPSQADIDKKKQNDENARIVNNTKKDLDSINKYYNTIEQFIVAGMTQGQATAMADSVALRLEDINSLEDSERMQNWIMKNIK